MRQYYVKGNIRTYIDLNQIAFKGLRRSGRPSPKFYQIVATIKASSPAFCLFRKLLIIIEDSIIKPSALN
jgi:hypothetical protein